MHDRKQDTNPQLELFPELAKFEIRRDPYKVSIKNDDGTPWKPDLTKEAVKYDNGKTRYRLLPPELEEAVAVVLEYGAKKYADRNWELGMDWSRPYDALRRHLKNWWNQIDRGAGPGVDEESNINDLKHAACNIAFLLAYQERNIGKDDRPKAR
jgi:hypothetical protein